MKTTTIRALKHETSTVLSWVASGESVEVRRRRELVAVLMPPKRKARVTRPDFGGRLRAAYGRRVLSTSGTELVSESRGES